MSLTLDWNSEQDAFEIAPELAAKLEKLLQIAGREENVETGEVALSFVTDEAIQELNRNYRGIDRPTDVLSFPMLEKGQDEMVIHYEEMELDEEDKNPSAEDEGFEDVEMLGDIVISVPRAVAQSDDYGHSVEREIGFLFVHGFLHLIGYDHGTEEEEKIMTGKQERILQEAGLTR
jgi:probable rRNA maturation factor